MGDQIKYALVLEDGLLVSLADGREALIKDDDVVAVAESTGAFARAEQVKTDDADEMS